VDATAPAAIRLEDVGKTYPGGSVAVGGLSLAIPEGELVALVGPSGCGKSTTLRMINRLIEPTSGHIWLGDEDVTTADPVRLRRRIGYVIQHVGLFPHQTVQSNVATVPRLLGWKAERTAARVNELLELVGLDPGVYRRRYPHELSGGQRQRVGVARALAADPVVLLMDEPFSAIDPIARARLQEEFLRLQREVRKTIVLVTHDIDEAVKLADRIAVLSNGGRLEQYADPSTLLGAPANTFVADFVGGDRSLRRLAVTGISAEDVVPFSAVGAVEPAGPNGVPTVAADATLKDAFALLLQNDADWIAVRDGDRYLGVLTSDGMRASLRRSTPEPAR
jgi:osmoprotectant transport system ATP-binding protein